MKHIHSFLSILAAAALALACMPEQVIPSIPEFKPEQSYLGIPYEGGMAKTSPRFPSGLPSLRIMADPPSTASFSRPTRTPPLLTARRTSS